MLVFKPIQIKELQLPNRLVMPPMCMYSADNGVANDFHFIHYSARSQGGAGLIIVESTGVTPDGRITPGCLGLWNDEQRNSLKRITDYIHQNSASKIGIQLNHSGRKGSAIKGKQVSKSDGGWQTMAPSEIAYQPGDRLPHKLSIPEIKTLTNAFKNSATRAVEAGFDTIEIHAAHGYLLHQFLSPKSNHRNDEYGGSFENRSRFLMEVLDAVKSVIPQGMPLFVRVSATEYADENNGWNLDDSIKLAETLKAKGVDLIDVSSGGNIHSVTQGASNSYQTPMAAEIKKQTGIMTGALGLINDIETAEQILQNGEADLVFMGRALLRNPYLPVLASFESGDDCFFPHQYDRGKPLK